MVQITEKSLDLEQLEASVEKDAAKDRKKAKKLAKKLAKKAAAEEEEQVKMAAENAEQQEKKKKKKKKKEPKEEEESPMQVEEKEEEGKEEQKEKKKKKKKRKAEEAAKEEEKAEEPKEKKKKKEDNEEEEEEEGEKESLYKKCFYTPTEKTLSLPQETIDTYYEKHSIAVSGRKSKKIRPILAFDDVNLDEKCLDSCKGFDAPTPIQAMCWPVIAGGRDVIGIAETGSGKTLAFSVPALVHMMHRKQGANAAAGGANEGSNKKKKGGKKNGGGVKATPQMLVLAPTRELAQQSQDVMVKAGKACGIKSTCLYGGVSKHEQRYDLNNGVDVIIATPGRLLDFIEEGSCDLSGISYLVLDEADRMLDAGFEQPIRAILKHTPKERQTCLFSATWPASIQKLAQEFLEDPVKVTVGSEDLAAGKNVTQIVEVVEQFSRDKLLQQLMLKYHKNNNRILVFVLYKKEADRVLQTLSKNGWNCTTIHGDKTQVARMEALANFKSGKIPILVATDVAARGLDIPNVEYVLNYSFPLTIEDYVHRIGRTGRAGKSGISHTFFHQGDKLRAGELVNVLKESKQNVPEEMKQFDLSVKRKEHKLYGNFGPKTYGGPMKKATKITFG